MFVLLTPPSEQEHRRRLRERRRRLSHQSEPTWDEVQARARRYDDWREPPVSIDSGQPLDVVIGAVDACIPE
jgi:hypothetical protein